MGVEFMVGSMYIYMYILIDIFYHRNSNEYYVSIGNWNILNFIRTIIMYNLYLNWLYRYTLVFPSLTRYFRFNFSNIVNNGLSDPLPVSLTETIDYIGRTVNGRRKRSAGSRTETQYALEVKYAQVSAIKYVVWTRDALLINAVASVIYNVKIRTYRVIKRGKWTVLVGFSQIHKY